MPKIIQTSAITLDVYATILQEGGIISKPRLEQLLEISPGQAARQIETLIESGWCEDATASGDKERWIRPTRKLAKLLSIAYSQQMKRIREIEEFAEGIKPPGCSLPIQWDGERVKELRERLDWTQPLMAKEFGCSRGYIAQVETGKRPIPETWLSKLDELQSVTLMNVTRL